MISLKNRLGVNSNQINKFSFLYTKEENHLVKRQQAPKMETMSGRSSASPSFSPPRALVRLNIFHSGSLGALYSDFHGTKQTSDLEFRKPELWSRPHHAQQWLICSPSPQLRFLISKITLVKMALGASSSSDGLCSSESQGLSPTRHLSSQETLTHFLSGPQGSSRKLARISTDPFPYPHKGSVLMKDQG